VRLGVSKLGKVTIVTKPEKVFTEFNKSIYGVHSSLVAFKLPEPLEGFDTDIPSLTLPHFPNASYARRWQGWKQHQCSDGFLGQQLDDVRTGYRLVPVRMDGEFTLMELWKKRRWQSSPGCQQPE
jgi:hypothetical protein